MSLISKLLGPQTVEEYAEAVKKRGESKVDVVVAAYDIFSEGLNTSFYNTYIRLISEGVKSDLYKDVVMRDKNSLKGIKGVYSVDKRTVQKALEYATRLKELGLEATISGRRIDEVKTMFDGYAEKANALSNDGSVISPEDAIAMRESFDKGKFIKSIINGKIFEYDGKTFDIDVTIKEDFIERILDEKMKNSEKTHIVGLDY